MWRNCTFLNISSSLRSCYKSLGACTVFQNVLASRDWRWLVGLCPQRGPTFPQRLALSLYGNGTKCFLKASLAGEGGGQEGSVPNQLAHQHSSGIPRVNSACWLGTRGVAARLFVKHSQREWNTTSAMTHLRVNLLQWRVYWNTARHALFCLSIVITSQLPLTFRTVVVSETSLKASQFLS
jgi:hypothetical protein